MARRTDLAIGLMSGTSLDGVDAALTEMRREGPRVRSSLRRLRHLPYGGHLAARLLALQAGRPVALAEVAALHQDLGEVYAEAVCGLLAAAGVPAPAVAFVAAHGQTILHQPPRGGAPGRTWQIGDPSVIAARTGLTVVSDFRAADMALGGQGAPLVPRPDWHLFADTRESRCIQNIGGIANVTWLPAGGGPEDARAFDTGPGNLLIDAAVRRLSGGAATMDRDGERAERGRVDEALLQRLLTHPFLALPPPKSTGREEFGDPFLDRILADWGGAGDDLVATLTAFTAESVARAYRAHLPRVDRVLVGGGGARNPALLRELARRLHPAPVERCDAHGVPAEAREAMAFALLGHLALRGEPGNLPAATGARAPVVLGRITPAPMAGGGR